MMQTNSVHTDRHMYTATYAGKLTHTDIFIHTETPTRTDRRAETDVTALTIEAKSHLG